MTVKAQDKKSGIDSIKIFFDNELVKECQGLTCLFEQTFNVDSVDKAREIEYRILVMDKAGNLEESRKSVLISHAESNTQGSVYPNQRTSLPNSVVKSDRTGPVIDSPNEANEVTFRTFFAYFGNIVFNARDLGSGVNRIEIYNGDHRRLKTCSNTSICSYQLHRFSTPRVFFVKAVDNADNVEVKKFCVGNREFRRERCGAR